MVGYGPVCQPLLGLEEKVSLSNQLYIISSVYSVKNF